MPPHESPTTVEPLNRGYISMGELAAVVADNIPAGAVLNLGIGHPTKIADHLLTRARRHPPHRERHAGHGPGC